MSAISEDGMSVQTIAPCSRVTRFWGIALTLSYIVQKSDKTLHSVFWGGIALQTGCFELYSVWFTINYRDFEARERAEKHLGSI